MLPSEDNPWFEIYKAAMLELDPQKLPERVAAANQAIHSRLREIAGDSNHHDEREQIEYALSGLRILEREK